MNEPIHIISLGAGVQSSTMALMASKGDISPMPVAAIFADTQAEPKSVYDWLDYLSPLLSFPVIRVTRGNLETKVGEVRKSKRSGNNYLRGIIPAFTIDENGRKGMLGRTCTMDYKITPLINKTREICAWKRGDKRNLAKVWIGISIDEAHRTKFEVQALLAQTSALMSSMLGRAYRQEHWACVEMARRFCIENSHDFEVKKFQTACIRDGVPRKYLDSSLWQIEVEQVLGNGNRAMELAEATELFQNMGAFEPSAQDEIKHDWALAVTGNPKKAARLAPVGSKPKSTMSVVDAQNKWGSLWVGAELEPVDGMNHIEQVATLISLMAGEVQKLTQGKPMTPTDVQGFGNVATFIAKHLKIMSGDEKMVPLVKKFTEDLKNIMGIVGQAAQQMQQQPQGQASPDPETMAKVQGMNAITQTKAQNMQMQAQVKAQNSQASTQLKLQQKQQSHEQKLAQQAASHQMDETMKAVSAKHDQMLEAMKVQNDLLISRIEAVLKPKKEPVATP